MEYKSNKNVLKLTYCIPKKLFYNNNKGLVDVWYFSMALRGIISAVILLIFVGIVGSFTPNLIDTSYQHAYIFTERVMHSRALLQQDALTLDLLPNTIDLQKFKEKDFPEKLGTTITYGRTDFLSAEFTLGNQKQYFNQHWWQRYAPLTGLAGKGGIYHFNFTYPVRVQDKDITYGDTLFIRVVMPR